MAILKYFIGNLDGSRQGLVLSTSKKAAAKAAETSLYIFNDYWHESSKSYLEKTGGVPDVDADTLYTRKMDSKDPWFKGRCRA